MDLLIIIFIAFIVGWLAGYRISTRIHVEGFRHILRSLNVSNRDLIQALRRSASPELLAQLELIEQTATEEPQDATVVEVKLEQHGGEIYAFRKDNDLFLGQAADGDSLIQRLNQNMKPCRVIIAREDGAELLQKNNG